jgi:hypothetical protein
MAVPAIMNFFSGMTKSALPMNGRSTSEEMLKIPIRKPISASLASKPER